MIVVVVVCVVGFDVVVVMGDECGSVVVCLVVGCGVVVMVMWSWLECG